MTMVQTRLKPGGWGEQTVANENKTLNYERGARKKMMCEHVCACLCRQETGERAGLTLVSV